MRDSEDRWEKGAEGGEKMKEGYIFGVTGMNRIVGDVALECYPKHYTQHPHLYPYPYPAIMCLYHAEHQYLL